MRALYSFVIYVYSFVIFLISPFNTKARLWWNGRKDVFDRLKEECKGKKSIFWIHCASLGEFEQGRPLIEKIKEKNPETSVLLTFFSPSGYEVRKEYPLADIVMYLPADTPANARKFIRIVNPATAVFVKYEYWFNYMDCLYKNSIPFYYISAIYREKQYFFKWYGNWFRKQLKKCTRFFVQDENSKKLLESIRILNVDVTGDTRFDRVYAIASHTIDLDFMVSFKNQSKLIVAGSTWLEDECILAALFSLIKEKYKVVIAPHVIDNKHIESVKKMFRSEDVLCYSESENRDIASYNVLIIDNVGMLSKIYKYSDISYIGGAFGKGLHNILEAAVFGVPLFFGTNYTKFNEAVELVRLGGAFSIQSEVQMFEKIALFDENQDEYQRVCTINREFVQQNLGACDKIMRYLFPGTR